MADLCSPDDVEAILQRAPGPSTGRLIELVTGLIEAATRQTWDVGAAPVGLTAICARVVARTISNPTQANAEQLGPHQRSLDGNTIRLTNRDLTEINNVLGTGTTTGTRSTTTSTAGIWT